MSFEELNSLDNKEKEKSFEDIENEFIKIANDTKEKMESLKSKDPSLLKHYMIISQTTYSYIQELKDPNNYNEDGVLNEDLKRRLDIITNINQVDRIKESHLKMPENFDGTNEEWHSLPKEIKEHIINGGTEVFLEPGDVISGGLMSIYVGLEKIIGKGVLLVIKESGKAFLKGASEEIIPIDLIKDGKEILELLKKKGAHLIESGKNIIKDVFSNNEMVTPEGIKINEKSFDNSENFFKMSKKEIVFEEALEKFVIPKDIETMTVKDFGRTLQEGIIRNLIDKNGLLNKMTENQRNNFFQKHIEAMDGILKWLDNNPKELKKFKEKIQGYFVDIKRCANSYNLEENKKRKILDNFIVLYNNIQKLGLK